MATKSKKAPKPSKKPASKKPVAKKAKPAAKKAAKPAAKKPAKKVVAKSKPLAKPVSKKTEVKAKAKPVKVIAKKPVVNHKEKPVVQDETSNRIRYSDRDLQEFKTLIEEKLEAARNELKYLNDQIKRKDDNGTDDTENKFATMEDGTVAMEREYLTQMAARQAQYIDHLEKALVRIQNKTYGVCRVTGKLIDKDRLRAVPHATLSMEAKMMMNK